ncbi:MAG TPA: patatin-like phospholipase family protein [Sphingomicrobium sp.]|nr:patatin-like phospholipase family protein [Sphingomicrobium sp.]HWJ58722.1 patatin-like phospholipase family protein [Sphingomicrobium sp.]
MVALVEPVSPLADKRTRGPSPGIGICLSGGGYRAMLFHLGAFLRLYELGLLQKATRISSVSGGSITSAKVALEWNKLKTRDDFFSHVVEPIRRVAGTTIDIPAIIAGVVLPGRVADYVAFAYRTLLFGRATLQDLPGKPEFVINATNVETGTLWRFSRAVMADYQVGQIDRPTLSLASAVAASSAFPPFLSPYLLRVNRSEFSKVTAKIDALLENISLTDGGVYDNLGLETVWKAYRNVLVSDAGAALDPDPSPSAAWARQAKRDIDIIYGQVSSLRKRQLIASFKAKEGERGWRRGTYWGIASNVDHYDLAGALKAPQEQTLKLARTKTRLKRLSPQLQEQLINWGYAICDTAVRKHFGQPNNPPADFPYPGGV